MPTELFSTAQQLGPLVEKLGVIGLLLVAVGWLAFDRLRLLKDVRRAYIRLDIMSRKYERVRAACMAHDDKIVVGVDDLEREQAELLAEVT
jgi:hypothetical protein